MYMYVCMHRVDLKLQPRSNNYSHSDDCGSCFDYAYSASETSNYYSHSDTCGSCSDYAHSASESASQSRHKKSSAPSTPSSLLGSITGRKS